MRVLLISTRRKIRAEWLAEQLAPLAGEELHVELVSLTRPAERLPVRRCLVLGCSLRPRRPVGEMATTTSAVGRPVDFSRVDRLINRIVPDRWTEDRALLAATGAAWSPEVRAMFEAADMVIAMDRHAAWAAWRLARRIPGPHVVHGVKGAVSKLAEIESAR